MSSALPSTAPAVVDPPSHAPPRRLAPARLATLRATGLLDGASSPALDRLTALAARLLGVPTTLVTLVDADRQVGASVGGAGETAADPRLSHSLCRLVVESGETLVVDDAAEHPLVCDEPAVHELGVRAYLGAPLRTGDGHVLGSLCAVDGAARAWTAEQRALLEDLAGAAAAELELRATTRRLAESTAAFEALLDGTTELVCTLDAEGRVTYANRAAQAALGVSEGGGRLPTLRELLPPSHRAAAREIGDAAARGAREVGVEVVLLGAGGRR
ncbi:GAF domain-containing protein, partial [Roseisolibacter sp. H3M3-2]|uniref:GAF domain-containing protein n=1 Tax=Roseisolibacter sp. H3M3-2 TaxID=3031323 RepID=UPI0023D98A2C